MILEKAASSCDFLVRQCAIRGLLAVQPLQCFLSDVQRLETEFKQEEKVQRKLVILQTLEGLMELAVEGKDERMLTLCRSLCMRLVEYLPHEKQSLVSQVLSRCDD